MKFLAKEENKREESYEPEYSEESIYEVDTVTKNGKSKTKKRQGRPHKGAVEQDGLENEVPTKRSIFRKYGKIFKFD